jgi:hypothetical protein
VPAGTIGRMSADYTGRIIVEYSRSRGYRHSSKSNLSYQKAFIWESHHAALRLTETMKMAAG